jgi:hypothetical protein
MPSLIPFRSKPYDFVPFLNLLNIILPVPGVILPSLSGKIFESRERYYCGNFIKSAFGPGIYAVFTVADHYEMRIVLSISNRNPDKRRFMVMLTKVELKSLIRATCYCDVLAMPHQPPNELRAPTVLDSDLHENCSATV